MATDAYTNTIYEADMDVTANQVLTISRSVTNGTYIKSPLQVRKLIYKSP